MRHINIPVFIPHLGCPNQCIFCNQKYISGITDFDEALVKKQIDDVLGTVGSDCCCEIAFFGGSFTGIDRDLMIWLLDLAQGYVEGGLVVGIRMSTRPDYISTEIIEILKKYTITCVELGIQSMNDEVLSYIKRGHTKDDTLKAIHLLNDSEIPFVGQMMVGLPKATAEDEIFCAEQICSLGAVGARIYPTLVFKNTELEHLTYSGAYLPLSLEEAVARSAAVLEVFLKNNVPCIRIGLCDSENLHSNDTFVAGPSSPSIGEMVKSRMYYNKIFQMLKNSRDYLGCSLIIECGKGYVSQVVGNKRKNIVEIKNRFGIKSISVRESSGLDFMELKIEVKEENSCD